MILPMLLAFAGLEPTLAQAQTCRAHMELLIEDVSRESEHVAGPTWFIRDWWTMRVVEAGAPDDDGAALAARKAELERERRENPDGFQAARGACVDVAINAGAVPGMALVEPE